MADNLKNTGHYSLKLALRTQRYAAIEQYRGRPLIVYATSTRPKLNAMMAGDVVREFIDQIDLVPEGDEVDVLINSTGGDALTAWKLMALLRERFKKVRVLVPFMAFSAATIFALGADEIVMHPHASLGPIDPQITVHESNGSVRQFAYEDVGAFLKFLTQEVKITEQNHTSAVIERLFAVVDPLNVGYAKRASDLSTDMGERLLRMHMTSPEDAGRARTIAENLNKSFFAHSDAVSRERATKLQLKVAASDPKLEKLLWDAYCGLESYMNLRKPFEPLQDILANPAAKVALQRTAPLNLPTDTPQPVAQQIYQALMNNAATQMASKAVDVPFQYVFAACESVRLASSWISRGYMSAAAQQDGSIKLNMVEERTGWELLTLPKSPSNEMKPKVDIKRPTSKNKPSNKHK